MGSLGEKDITEVEANESYGTLAYVDEAHKVFQWILSNFLKFFFAVVMVISLVMMLQMLRKL